MIAANEMGSEIVLCSIAARMAIRVAIRVAVGAHGHRAAGCRHCERGGRVEEERGRRRRRVVRGGGEGPREKDGEEGKGRRSEELCCKPRKCWGSLRRWSVYRVVTSRKRKVQLLGPGQTDSRTTRTLRRDVERAGLRGTVGWDSIRADASLGKQEKPKRAGRAVRVEVSVADVR